MEVVKALVELGADLHALGEYNEQTALHITASEGHVEVVKALVKLGADVYAEDCEEHTAFHDAAELGHTRMEVKAWRWFWSWEYTCILNSLRRHCTPLQRMVSWRWWRRW